MDAVGSTFDELADTTSRLSKDPELRRKAEDEIRKTLPEGSSFWIDNAGFGHLATSLHVTSVNTSVVDGSTSSFGEFPVKMDLPKGGRKLNPKWKVWTCEVDGSFWIYYGRRSFSLWWHTKFGCKECIESWKSSSLWQAVTCPITSLSRRPYDLP